MTVREVFAITRRGLVANGVIDSGSVRAGDAVRVGDSATARVDAVEIQRKRADEAHAGDTVGLLFTSLEKGQIVAGTVLTSDGTHIVV